MAVIREATEEDIAVIVQMDHMLGGAVWDEGQWRDILQSRFYRVFLAEENSEIAGFMVVYIGVAEVHLMKLFVRQMMRGKGIGHLFMEKLIDVAKESGKALVFLEVSVSNKGAISLYEEFGFKILKVLPDFYGEGKDAYLMLKEIGRESVMDKIIVALGSEDGKVMVNDHLGEAPMFYVYEVTPTDYKLIDKRTNDAPEEKEHGDPRKRQRVTQILEDADVLLAPQVSTSFVKMKEWGKWQPVVTKDVVDIDTAMRLIQENFSTIAELVKSRREGKPTGKIVFFKDGEMSFI